MRQEAAQLASEAGLLPAGLVRLWLQGEWREVLLFGWELHDEPTQEHEPQVEEWQKEATLALRRGDADEAERLLRRALEVEPDAPDLLNNLAVTYEQQGRRAEVETLLRRIIERHPDYAFAPISLARVLLQRGERAEARDLLQSLLARRRLHYSEFAALCAAQADLYLAEGNRDAARSWRRMGAEVDPDNPSLTRQQRQLARPRLRRR